ncbi:MAG: GNAT family N-acetyltransferase [Anaerolineales bacterium]|uniref:GNAT family N-acetyltransferase n=1 Tax=Candidatus Villigracilis proximus TaxID=3140683 RepID=UPI003136E5C8|nr:GNAT family N-acetyltransferase [Anaerolineales bacterium]
MQIDIVSQADEELYQALKRLIPQLTNNNPPPSLNELAALVRETASTLMIARDESGVIVGALTLAAYRVPSGVRAMIEDVIVDESARGRGIGEALIQRAIAVAKEKGVGTIALTSSPFREAANRLYVRMGFQKRETNAYQLKLNKTAV